MAVIMNLLSSVDLLPSPFLHTKVWININIINLKVGFEVLEGPCVQIQVMDGIDLLIWCCVSDLLSSNLCSLRGNVDRFAFSVIWEMSPESEVLSSRFATLLMFLVA